MSVHVSVYCTPIAHLDKLVMRGDVLLKLRLSILNLVVVAVGIRGGHCWWVRVAERVLCTEECGAGRKALPRLLRLVARPPRPPTLLSISGQ